MAAVGNNHLQPLQSKYSFCLRCTECCNKESECSFTLRKLAHGCSENILLVSLKNITSNWRPVSPLPPFCNPKQYEVCWHFKEKKGCTKHGEKCTYARSQEEAAVWNFLKANKLSFPTLVNMVKNHQMSCDSNALQRLAKIETIFCNGDYIGRFLELCKRCFHSSPQKICPKLNEKCSSRHRWEPLLVFCMTEKTSREVYEEIRPLPKQPLQSIQYCMYVTKGEQCRHGDHRCFFAHNELEKLVWKLECEGVDRSEILKVHRAKNKRRTIFCTLCRLHFSDNGLFMNHCFTVKHRRQIFEEESGTWKYRHPPPTNKNLILCRRSLICEYGDNCTDAHSQEELQEWQTRIKFLRRRAEDAAKLGLLSYQDDLLEEYRHSQDKKTIMNDTLPDVSITCEPDISSIYLRERGMQCTWNFKIFSKEPLEVIALLRREAGATFTVGKDLNVDHSYSTGCWFLESDARDQMVYEVPVSFKSLHAGLYEQWVVFDFNTRPVLQKKLKVRVGDGLQKEPEKSESKSPEVLVEAHMHNDCWNQEIVTVVPFAKSNENHAQLLKKYKLVCTTNDDDDDFISSIKLETYKNCMHSFLFKEEQVEGDLIARLNLRGTVQLTNCLFNESFGSKYSYPGQLFAAVPLSHALIPDTPQSYIMKRHVYSALVLGVTSPDHAGTIYEAELLKDAIGEGKVHLHLSKPCCTDFNLQNGQTCQMIVQFQLQRLWFCMMHKAIDDLKDMDTVLPSLRNSFHISPQLETGEFNLKQQAAMDFILGTADTEKLPPLLIYGPFGTGKTRTLASMAKTLALKPGNKILICTHTNSSADLYVKNYFHEFVADHQVARPLRIKAKESKLSSTDSITLEYCHLTNDRMSFGFPGKGILDSHRVIITTTGLAIWFHDLKLPDNYFSHILIDEASQMLECEALMALGMAGKMTRVVLAGDHMQMGPRLFSVKQDKCAEHTLLNRLFYHYQSEKSTTAKKSRIIFNENYRSTKDIVEFVSTHFYVGKSDVIKARGDVPPHPWEHALQFYHIRGECRMDATNMSWLNLQQVECVVEIVREILNNWPTEEWGPRDPSSVCVLSQGPQVYAIRQQFAQRRLPRITVENAENVQGKQFRVIVVSTVHTKDSLLGSNLSCLEFFNDARVLNTVMTRAQSQIFIVGDAAALASAHFGSCWRLWRSYIEECISKENAHYLTLDSLKQDLLEISELHRCIDEENTDSESVASEISDTEDPILKELLDENKPISISLTEDGVFPILKTEHLVCAQDTIDQLQQEKLQHTPLKLCELVTETFQQAIAKPLDEPSMRINIKGRKNMGHSFPGDKVMVEILSESSPPMGRVINVIESADTLKEFVCTIDKYDDQVMTPINKCVTKIFTPFWKCKPGHIAVKNPKNHSVEFIKINEKARNNLYVVKICIWKNTFKYPLGVVMGMFPKVTTLEQGLKVLGIEYQLNKTTPSPVLKQVQDLQTREDFFEDGRVDLRSLPAFTIDPAHSQDLDDAISVVDAGECYEIGIHISDVASFVEVDSKLDIFARQQGTTFYPPDREPIYMFPKELSARLFSLIPDHDRRAISLIVQIDKQTDQIQKRVFCKSVIRSQRKFSYDDVEDILENVGCTVQCSNCLKAYILKACHFAEVHRKFRKQEDWCYKSLDEDSMLGRRRSHRLVEELMIMFNSMVAECLLMEEPTRNLTPLRCQDRPKRENVIDIFNKNASLIPLSVHFSSQSLEMPNSNNCSYETFPVLKSVLSGLKIAGGNQDVQKIIDYVSTDDIHPMLYPLVISFRKLFHKAYILRSNSSHVSKIGHCDLDLDCYTWASSPARRYIDIVVQRLLHSMIDKTRVKYTAQDINLSCLEFSRKNDKQSAYDKKSKTLHFASKLSNQNETKVAYIVELNPSGTSFRISFPLHRSSISDNLNVLYRDLQLSDQPEFDQSSNCTILRWVRRIYSFSSPQVKVQNPRSLIAHVPRKTWERLAFAVSDENQEEIISLVENLEVDSRTPVRYLQCRPYKGSRTDRSDPILAQHYLEISLRFKQSDAVQVQLGAATDRGLMIPAVRLFVVNPSFEICLEHVSDPVKCFSEYALHSSRDSYRSYMEYQEIWKPMCKMESASNAVTESESIILQDVSLKWKTSSSRRLHGSFLLPLDKKAQWSIECDLRNCFLCLRTKIDQTCSPSLEVAGSTDLMGIPFFTWVGHAIIINVDEETKERLQIDFQMNHMPMSQTPQVIFNERTRFTVELIPKTLPDVRKENAICRLTKANQLVKSIAMGRKINTDVIGNPDQIPVRFELGDYLPSGFSCLNNSQSKAIREALTNSFTLIQGPPGTGKTIVGVHIVFWLHKKIKEIPASNSQKKRAILYCGPSNKSVDVVADHLLKLQQHVKPLRVYSDQMAMLDYPYPGCNLKLSRNSKRGEKPNSRLKSIALHHLIRDDVNPFSSQIRAFDMKIRRGDQLTDEEKKLYKKCLNDARKYQLQQHDVILCTCTAASHPVLSNVLDLKQIIIDECAMATEPEAFIPLVAHKPEQIVLIGDHKQLQPIVKCEDVDHLGMSRSLFERYMERAIMLDTQYRMQEEICEFPSNEFYRGELKTQTPHRPCVFQMETRKTHIVFGHVEGQEKSLVVSTEQGNENSKENIEEAIEVVRVARLLTEAGIEAKNIAILTPYNAQVKNISKLLQNVDPDITVNTIMKSQGSEWKYVIISTVRSCPEAEIESQPPKSWIQKKLGFITDQHQVNVGITRAQEGLCIIGNEKLLRCSLLWRRLLDHYQKKGCLVNPAGNIRIPNLRQRAIN